MTPIARVPQVLAAVLLSTLVAAPRPGVAQEPEPIGGEWAPFDCPMPVMGMSPAGPPRPTTHAAGDTLREELLREYPMPMLTRRCFNPLAVTPEPMVKLRIEQGHPRQWLEPRDRLQRWPDPFRFPMKRDRFRLLDPLELESDSTP